LDERELEIARSVYGHWSQRNYVRMAEKFEFTFIQLGKAIFENLRDWLTHISDVGFKGLLLFAQLKLDERELEIARSVYGHWSQRNYVRMAEKILQYASLLLGLIKHDVVVAGNSIQHEIVR
jgi:hypothetical protein